MTDNDLRRYVGAAATEAAPELDAITEKSIRKYGLDSMDGEWLVRVGFALNDVQIASFYLGVTAASRLLMTLAEAEEPR
jgi:hypothetical protein